MPLAQTTMARGVDIEAAARVRAFDMSATIAQRANVMPRSIYAR